MFRRKNLGPKGAAHQRTARLHKQRPYGISGVAQELGLPRGEAQGSSEGREACASIRFSRPRAGQCCRDGSTPPLDTKRGTAGFGHAPGADVNSM